MEKTPNSDAVPKAVPPAEHAPAPALFGSSIPAAASGPELPMHRGESTERERKKLYETHRDELWKRELSNAESFDKAILAYSSAGLAFSLGFLKDFVAISKATIAWALYFSWSLFTLAIITTIGSYILSQFGIKKELKRAEAYYLDNQEEAYNHRSKFAFWTEVTNLASGILFIAAIVLTTLFVSFNLSGASEMSNSKKVIAQDGAPIPNIQKPQGPLEKGAPIPNLQKVPQPQGQTPSQTPNKQGS